MRLDVRIRRAAALRSLQPWRRHGDRRVHVVVPTPFTRAGQTFCGDDPDGVLRPATPASLSCFGCRDIFFDHYAINHDDELTPGQVAALLEAS